MAEAFDIVANYGRAMGWELRHRTVLVEGTTDAELFRLAAQLELKQTGVDLLGDEVAIIAAGERDRGGIRGVVRELNALRCFARATVMSNGRPRYRFIGLFDNDDAGRRAIIGARNLDSSILEYKDVFRVHPVMPCTGNIDPIALQKTFERLNGNYKGLDWELEDLLPNGFFYAFLNEYPSAVARHSEKAGLIHRDLTRDGKAQFHKFVKQHAIRDDLCEVVKVLHSIRFCFALPKIAF
jgi:hypothetical protein